MKTNSDQTGIVMTTRALIAAVALCGVTATAQAQQGLTLRYYQYSGNPATGLFDPLSNLLATTPTSNGTFTGAINFPVVSTGLHLPVTQNYAILWTGWFVAPVAGTYNFQTSSDDGSLLYIDLDGDGVFTSPTERIVNNNAYQGTTAKSGAVLLAAKSYRIAIPYYQGTGGEVMTAQYELPGATAWTNVDTTTGAIGFYITDPNALQIQNVGASNVTMTAAALYGNLLRTGTATTATSVFWGQADRYPSTNGWDGAYAFGTAAATGTLSTTVSSLTPNTLYYFRFFATNSFGGVWATNRMSFTTLPSLPVMANVAVSNVTTSSAFLNGFVVGTGAAPVTVSVFYGPTDGTTNWGQWANTNTFAYGQWDQWTYPTYAAGSLLPATNYYYTYYGTNSSGDAWVTNSAYFITGELSLTATDPSCGTNSSDTATVTVTRPNTCTNGDLVVNYTTAGDATNGVQFTTSPASGVLKIPAGQTSATIAITAIAPWNSWAAKSFAVSLLPGPYAIGAGGTANCRLEHYVAPYDTWLRQAPIQFAGYNRSETLTNFPALVILGANVPGFSYNQFLSGSNADLRFTDSSGLTSLNFEIEQWNPAGNSYVWVQVPQVTDSNTTILAWWGKAGQTALPCTTNGATWASAYRGVWHLGQANALDSTTNANNGTGNGNTTVTGEVGPAQSFTPNQSINCGNAASVNVSGDMTFSAWVKRNGTGEMGILGKWGNSYLWDTCYDKNSVYFGAWASGTTTIPVGQWVYLSVSFTNATKTLAFFYNGLPDGSTAYNYLQGSGQNLYIGYRGDQSYMNGLIDEARLEATPRSANWIWACYMNQAANTTFLNYSASLAPAARPGIDNAAPANVTTSSATLNGNLWSVGAPPATVSLFWGNTDGSTNGGVWANTAAFAPGQWAAGTYPTTNLTLASGLDWYYTYSVTNALTNGLASPSQYFITGELNVQATDALCASNASDTATFTVTRPATCTASALPFNYTLSGAATNGVDYTIAWANGSAVIPAGQTSATLTITPNITVYNFMVTKDIVVTLNPGNYALGASNSAAATFQPYPSASYTWDNTKNGQYVLNAANWLPTGQFTNVPTEVCDINAGGVANCGAADFAHVTFNARLNLNSNALINGGGYRYVTFANMHLRGGTFVGDNCGSYYGLVTVDNDSVLNLHDAGDGVLMAAEFRGSANLVVSNGLTSAGRYTYWPITANNTNYSGVWSFYNTWPGRFDFNGAMGTGGLNFTPMSSNICINANTVCPWTLDVRGVQVQTGVANYPSPGVANPTHTGTFTLLSDVILRAGGPGAGVIATINGRITGAGRLGTLALSEDNPGAGNTIKLGGSNDFTGGTVVMTNILEAAAAGSLGAGPVDVQPGNKQLQVDVAGTFGRSASLYLDFSGASYGNLNVHSAAVTARVARVFIGGLGGWANPVGYTELLPGTYTASSPGMANYISGPGTLLVAQASSPGQPVIYNFGGASNVTASSAMVGAYLSDTGGAPVTVSVCWGTTDGGTNTASWTHVDPVAGSWQAGSYPVATLSGLSPNTVYYYTFLASNGGPLGWATPSKNFFTGVLSLTATDPNCGATSRLDTATVIASRPASCTNEALDVRFTATGTAVAGTDYTINPVTYVLQIPAGQTSATITITPIMPPFNYGADKSIILTASGPYATDATSTATCWLKTVQAGVTYTWVGASYTSWLTPANWSPSGFQNFPADVCNVNAGGGPLQTPNLSVFFGQLNLNPGSVLQGALYNNVTFSNLHLRGGTLQWFGDNALSGFAVIESNSVLQPASVDYGVTMALQFYGSSGLLVSNSVFWAADSGRNTTFTFPVNNTNYSGVWTFWNTAGYTFNLTGNPGTGGLNFIPQSSNVLLSVNTACPWTLDCRGTGVVTVAAGGASVTHSGVVTVNSTSKLVVNTSNNGNNGVFTNKVTGPGKLLSNPVNNDSRKLILSCSANDYAGGTELLTYTTQAATNHAMGNGHVHVDTNATLEVLASNPMNTSAWLYLDASGSTTGKITMASAAVTTLVARAYVGGAGGWEAPSGYTRLGPGIYKATTLATTNFIIGAGALVVPNPSGTTIFFQ